jgi:hypothetical protein
MQRGIEPRKYKIQEGVIGIGGRINTWNKPGDLFRFIGNGKDTVFVTL